MRLVITGSRTGHPKVEAWMREWNRKHGAPELCVVGDAAGVDTLALLVCKSLGWPVVRVVVNPLLQSPRKYLERNERMVAMATRGDACLAFPGAESRGTYHCAGLARKAGLSVYVAPTGCAA